MSARARHRAMRRVAARGGFATVEYVGVVVLVAVLIGTLVAVRPHEASRRPPMNPARAIARLVTQPVAPRPRAAPRPSSVKRRPSRSRPARLDALVVEVPRWAVGR